LKFTLMIGVTSWVRRREGRDDRYDRMDCCVAGYSEMEVRSEVGDVYDKFCPCSSYTLIQRSATDCTDDTRLKNDRPKCHNSFNTVMMEESEVVKTKVEEVAFHTPILVLSFFASAVVRLSVRERFLMCWLV
jgi:hypothetical protein